MNAGAKIKPDTEAQADPLARLRAPFPAHQISKLPKETKKQADDRKADMNLGIKCQVCGGWHHKNAVHLDYVGHAALTDRLLDTDPNWSWEPMALRDGLPAFDQTGGLWIKLTVCRVTRLGYGNAASKPQMDPGAREKEVIGDALRNAAMRFGAALDLWHKGDLHLPDTDGDTGQDDNPKPEPAGNGTQAKPAPRKSSAGVVAAKSAILATPTDSLPEWLEINESALKSLSTDDYTEVMDFYRETVKPYGRAEEVAA